MMSPSSGSRYLICVITLCLAVTVKQSCAKLPYGAPCTRDKECQKTSSLYSFSFSLDIDDTKCKDGKCACNYNQIRKFTNNNYECHGRGLNIMRDTCKVNDPESCINGVCEKDDLFFERKSCKCSDGFTLVGETCREMLSVAYGEGCETPDNGSVPICDYDNLMYCTSGGNCGCYSGYFYDKENSTCISPNDYAKKYPEEVTVNLDEACKSSSADSLPKLCDEEAHMKCQDKKCKCTKEYYPVESNKTCESKQSYVEAHNLTSYKVMPGVYCSSDSECITGLDCFKNKCSCPHPCTFASKTSSCDCGEVSVFEGASRAILVGVIGGILIIIFWIHMIKKTINKGKEMSKRKEEAKKNDPASAGLIHFVSNRMEDDQNDYNDHNVVKARPATPPPGVRTLPSNVITAGDPPAPYGLDPPTAPLGFSASTPTAPPHQQPPYTGATTPYPVSPTRPSASDTSPSRIPYPVSPGSAYASNTTSFPSAPGTDAYPHSPASGVTPSYGTPTVVPLVHMGGDTTAPPAYTPSYQTGATAPPAVDIYKPII